MKLIKVQLAYWLPVYVWAVLIFYLSSTTPVIINTKEVISPVIFSDFYKHIFAYGFFTFLLWYAFSNSKFKYSEILAIMVAVLYGIANEMYQYSIPGRNCSFFDITLNFLGCILVQPLIMLYKNFKK